MLKIFKKKEKKQKSVFMGKKVRKYWDIYEGSITVRLEEKTETLNRIKILEKEMTFEFNELEEIFLEETGKYCKIEKKTKDTNGDIVYNISYVAEVVEDYNVEIKAKYEKMAEECRIRKATEDAEYYKKKEEDQAESVAEADEYIKFCEDKSKVVKKGVIIQKIPMNRDGSGSPLIDLKMAGEFHKKINMLVPMEYDVITTPMDIEMVNYEVNGEVDCINNERVIFKN